VIGPGRFEFIEREQKVNVVANYLSPLLRIGELPINGDLVTDINPILHGFGRNYTKCGPFAAVLEVFKDGGCIRSNSPERPQVPSLRNRCPTGA
jgi:hypothetical protein